MPTAVVTGGAGFLGSHLCEYLLDKVWSYEYGGVDSRTVDTHVLRLRKKLGPVGERIETVQS